jgi:hypothetical protein
MQFGVLFTPRLRPGDPQTMHTQAAVSTAFAQNYEGKTVETVLLIQSLPQPPG